MTDLRPVCVPCSERTKRIVRFKAEMNGVYIPYAYTLITGDLWKCPECGTQFVDGFSKPHYTGDNKAHIEELRKAEPEFFPLSPEVKDK